MKIIWASVLVQPKNKGVVRLRDRQLCAVPMKLAQVRARDDSVRVRTHVVVCEGSKQCVWLPDGSVGRV